MDKWKQGSEPTDGTPILVWCEHCEGRQIAVCWAVGDSWMGGPALVPGFKILAWMHLPEPPRSRD